MDIQNAGTKPRCILDLTHEEKLQFLNSFDTVLSDIDGVIWNLLSPIEGAGDGMNKLKNAGKNIGYITNNSVRPDEDYIAKFKAAGIDFDLKDMIHPAKSVVEYLNKNKFEGLIYCIATQKFEEVLRKAGYKVIDGPNKILLESFTDLARHVFDKEPVRAVVMDVDFNLSAPKLIRAHQYLRNPDCLLIAGATDMMLPVGRGIQIIGPGPYLKVLAEASNRKPVVVGKPGLDLRNIIMEYFNVSNPSRTLMIGDMLEQDIGFGKNCGFQTLVVLSGGCKKEDLDNHTNPVDLPDYYANSMGDFVKFFETINTK